jgi:hypothetical protein
LIKWSCTPIIFDEEDHPDRTTTVGCLPLLVSPTICNLKVTKMLVDGGAGLNLISSKVISKLHIAEEELKVTSTFQGINPGRSRPKGKITLPVTFGGELNYRTEKIVFDVVDLPQPYNRILGRPSLAKFMAASHYAYKTLKMPEPMGVFFYPIRQERRNHMHGQDVPGGSCCRSCGSHFSRQGKQEKEERKQGCQRVVQEACLSRVRYAC